jgi:hypothetical protein
VPWERLVRFCITTRLPFVRTSFMRLLRVA